MSNNLSQELRLEQSLSLSPIQLLTSKLVELTNLELQTRIEHELEDNPALEEGLSDDTAEPRTEQEPDTDQEWELGEYASEDDIPAYKLREITERQAFREEIPFASSSPTLLDVLLEQLALEGISELEKEIATYIIGDMTPEGYLSSGVEDLQDDLLLRKGIEVSKGEITQIIDRIKSLEPAGVGAKDLRECLLLQLRAKADNSPNHALATRILEDYYDAFTAKNYEQLATKLAITSEQLSGVYAYISRLNPRPALGLTTDADQASYYHPDFVVEKDLDDELSLTLVGEKEVRPLRLSPEYQQMLEGIRTQQNSRQKRETQDFLKYKLDQARWFIEALAMRQDTLRRTMLAIIAWQKAFFLTGDISDLRPMVLRDISAITGLDMSTISRVSNSKSVQTPYGVYPVKFFFGEGIVGESGEEISTKAIKMELQKLIDGENKKAPLTDEDLANALGQIGYPLARRTVAKYREELRIPIARLRREL